MSRFSQSARWSVAFVALFAMILYVGCSKSETASDGGSNGTTGDEVGAEQPSTEWPSAEQPGTEQPTTEQPSTEQPTTEQPSTEQPGTEQPSTEQPSTEKPSAEQPATEQPGTEQPSTEQPAAEQPEPSAAATPLKKAELLVELPDEYNTPDGMCLLPNGDVLVSVPNVNVFLAAEDKSKQDPPPVILRITKDDKYEKYYDPPKNPVTGYAFPFGICIDPEGKNLYVTDLQWFANTEEPGNNSRVLRVPLDENYNPAGDPVVLIQGMVVANAVIVHNGYLYVTDTTMVPRPDPKEPQISGIFRVKLDEEGTKLTLPLLDDPHLVATLKSYNPDVGFGADGLTFDSKGNLYCGNFADGTLHKIEFDADGNPKRAADGKPIEAPIFAKAPFMKSCDGIFCDLATDKIYVADSLANAVQIVSPDGSVQTLARDEENDGSGGRLDQPCEVLLRDNEVIVSNMDFPVPGGVNQTFDKPYTMSIIKLDQ